MTEADSVSGIAIATAVVILGGAVVLLIGLFRTSRAPLIGVKIIGIGVFLPVVLGGVALLAHGTGIDLIGRALSALQIAVGLAFMVRVLRLHLVRHT